MPKIKLSKFRQLFWQSWQVHQNLPHSPAWPSLTIVVTMTFLLLSSNTEWLFPQSSQHAWTLCQHTVIQCGSVHAWQCIVSPQRKTCCAMDMLSQGMPSIKADSLWNSASVIKPCVQCISLHTDSRHPWNCMLVQFDGQNHMEQRDRKKKQWLF